MAGRKALMEADVVVADRLAPRELLGDLPATTEVVDVAKLPRGECRAPGGDQPADRRAGPGRSARGAVQGWRQLRVRPWVRGDRGLPARPASPVHVIPGLSSPLAVPAVAGIPVTHRGVAHEFTVVSGHLPPGHPDSLVDWDAVGRAARHPAADDGGRERARDRRGAASRPAAPGDPGRGRLRRVDAGRAHRAHHPRRRSAPTSTGTPYARPAIIVVGDVVAVAHPQHFSP